jgi:flagellar biosynthesis/type III secretory pathway chaperone
MTHEWIHKLYLILEQMESLYARVIPLLDKERSSLVEMNYERLYIELKEKDEILALLRKLDRERLRIQDYFAALTGTSAAAVTLRSLGEMLIDHGGPDAELGARLLAQRERIECLVNEIRRRIESNGRFIDKSVKNLRGLARILSESTQPQDESEIPPHHQTYTVKARVKKAPQKSGSIVTKQL